LEKLFYRASEFTEVTGIARTTLYELIRSGEIKVVRLGSRTLIHADHLREWAERLTAEQVR